jgi:hypothetical protein
MAFGTLGHIALVVIIVWRRMAGAAVCQPVMAEIDVVPLIRFVTVGTLARKMAAGAGMTGLAVGKSVIVEINITPITGIVAAGTLAREMAAWPGMARLTSVKAAVIEINL